MLDTCVYRNCEGLNADQVVLVEDDPQDSDEEFLRWACWWEMLVMNVDPEKLLD